MNKGFIYPTLSFLIELINKFSLVEYLKNLIPWTYNKISKKPVDQKKTKSLKNIAIDSFIVLKWLLLGFFILTDNSSVVAKGIVYYLIFFNCFTYFYYHAWGSNFRMDEDRVSQRRRFLNFLLSIAFYIICYAYLYYSQFFASISWPSDSSNMIDAIYLSVANAFTLTYGDFSPLNQGIRMVFLTELVNTFFFFTIIVTNSIPTINSEK